MKGKSRGPAEKVVILSHILSNETPFYGGEKTVSLKESKAIKKGDSCNTMRWSMPNHAGTHVDAPLHFFEKAEAVSDFEAADWVFNKVTLVDIAGVKEGRILQSRDLGDIEDCELVLIKTGFENNRAKEVYWRNSPGLHPGLAGWIKGKCPSIRAVGMDFISASNMNNRELGWEAHKAFLGEGILLVEDMRLSELDSAPDTVIIAPLLAEKADGAPCTALGIYK